MEHEQERLSGLALRYEFPGLSQLIFAYQTKSVRQDITARATVTVEDQDIDAR